MREANKKAHKFKKRVNRHRPFYHHQPPDRNDRRCNALPTLWSLPSSKKESINRSWLKNPTRCHWSSHSLLLVLLIGVVVVSGSPRRTRRGVSHLKIRLFNPVFRPSIRVSLRLPRILASTMSYHLATSHCRLCYTSRSWKPGARLMFKPSKFKLARQGACRFLTKEHQGCLRR